MTATNIFGVSSPRFADLPVGGDPGLITKLNTEFAGLLTDLIIGFQFAMAENQKTNGYDFRIELTYNPGASAIATPYLVQGFAATNAEALAAAAQAFINLNPGYFYSSLYICETDADRHGPKIFGIIVYNTVYANGAQNWALINFDSGGMGPTGPAGGDLSGTYPNPSVFVGQLTQSPGAVLTTLDTVPLASFRSVDWAVSAWNSGTSAAYTSVLSATSDGTTPQFVENDVVLQPPNGGTFDFDYSVAISGADMLLQVTPASPGWVFTVRRISELA